MIIVVVSVPSDVHSVFVIQTGSSNVSEVVRRLHGPDAAAPAGARAEHHGPSGRVKN